MKNAQKHMIIDINRMISDSFADVCRAGQTTAFTRKRKMPLNDILLTMINRKGLTLALELRNYMKVAHPGQTISKQGYLQQRLKLNPDAFLDLYHFHNKNFYSDPGYYTQKGFLLLAADGSDINIPTTKETLELFGNASRKNTKPQAQIGLGCIYDVLNRMILESDCCKVKFDEMRVAEQQMERLRDTIGDIPYIMVMDRGYPSTPAFIHMMENGIYFVVRLKSSDYKKEQQSLKTDDEMVDIELDRSRIYHYKGTADGERMKELGKIRLRMVRIHLENKADEMLITNLPQELFLKEDLDEIYHARWNIETAYEILKDRLQIENFTGTKARLLLQDIYSTIYVSNLAEDIIHDAELELNEKENDRKHKMAVNQTLSIGILKNDFIYIVLEKDPKEKERLFQILYDDISKNLVPIRPDRHYPRTKGHLAGKYSNTHKRAF